MAGMGQHQSGSGPPPPSSSSAAGPKILLAKPPAAARADGGVKLMRDRLDRDDDNAARVRLPSSGSVNLLTEAFDFVPLDRLLPLMSSDNTDFTVVGVLGPPWVGKSTIMNELYGFDASTAIAGVLPPFPVMTEETRALARHSSVGIELRVTMERLILLDCQPLFSASLLMDMMRSDAYIGDALAAEFAHEMLGLQLGVFLSSVCHVLLVVSEGLHDFGMWRLMQTVEMLKQGIPDPSTLPSTGPTGPTAAVDKVKEKDDAHAAGAGAAVDEVPPDYFSDTVFVHTKLQKHESSWPEIQRLGKALSLFFHSPPFRRNVVVRYRPPQFPADYGHHWTNNNTDFSGKQKSARRGENGVISLSGRPPAASKSEDKAGPTGKKEGETEQDTGVNFFVLPLRVADELTIYSHESYSTTLVTLRNQILSMPRRSFLNPLTERDWLRNAARMWDLVKKSPVLGDYGKFLQSAGLYR